MSETRDTSEQLSGDEQQDKQHEPEPAPPPRKTRPRPTQKRQPNRPLNRNMANNFSLKDDAQAMENTTGGMPSQFGNALQETPPAAEGDTKKDTLRLRLDLNLEVEITLKARIHGDLTLALLN